MIETRSGSGRLQASVVISQPVHQHAYESAIAARDRGLLQWFFTSFYDGAVGAGGGRRLAALGPLATPVRRELSRRSHPELDPAVVATVPWFHAMAYTLRPVRPQAFARFAERWAHERFDVAVARRIRRDPPGLVHAFEGAALATLQVARAAGAITVLDVPNAHEMVVASDGSGSARLLKRIHAERELADLLLAPSPFVIDCLLDAGVQPDRIVELPYGVDAERFAPAERRASPFRVLFVGQVGKRKGVLELLAAWDELRLPDAELVLVGSADEIGTRALRGRPTSCRWVGRVPRAAVERWYRDSDVFVFPTWAEGSALVVYEAMASGLPVVTTPAAGSVVRDEIDGLIVPAGDGVALRTAISRLHADHSLRRRMGNSARELILARYTWRHYRRRLADVYEHALTGGA